MRYILNNPAKAKSWDNEYTVWVDSSLVGDTSMAREEAEEEPW